MLGHPFNPPHLIPLVEVMGNERTDVGVVARAFYESVGKVTIEVRREEPGHVANRLQAALWREAIHLVNEGVANVADRQGGRRRPRSTVGGHGPYRHVPPRCRRWTR